MALGPVAVAVVTKASGSSSVTNSDSRSSCAMTTSRKKHGVAFWATVVVASVVVSVTAYPASFIGLLLLARAGLLPEAARPLVETVYAPLIRLILH
jgi:hypothetical protein